VASRSSCVNWVTEDGRSNAIAHLLMSQVSLEVNEEVELRLPPSQQIAY
jgi:hypothetical protein